jgi:hypothetical protein
MDNPRVFQEYALSDGWIAAHLGRFAGYLFAFAGLVVLSQLLLGERAHAPRLLRTWALPRRPPALRLRRSCRRSMGSPFKTLVDHWAQAAGPQQAVAFGAAESVRWLEIGIDSLFRLLQGTTLVVVGLALMLSDRFPRWLDGSASKAASRWFCAASLSPSWDSTSPIPRTSPRRS